MPACCSPSVMPDGSGRKVIAAHAGGAFWVAALVAASAGERTKPRAKPIPTVSALLIVNSSYREATAYSPGNGSAVELIDVRLSDRHADCLYASGGLGKERAASPRASR